MLEIESSALLLGKIDDLSLNSKMHPPHFAARQHMQTVFGIISNALLPSFTARTFVHET